MEDKDSFFVMVTRLEAPVDEAEPQTGDQRGTKTGLERESQRRVQRCARVSSEMGLAQRVGGDRFVRWEDEAVPQQDARKAKAARRKR